MRRYDGTTVMVNGLVAPLGSTRRTPPIASWAYVVAPITIVARPVSETDAVAPGVKVCASTVVPVDEVTLIQQSDVVAPTRREYAVLPDAVVGVYVADELVALTAVYLGGIVVEGVVGAAETCGREPAAGFAEWVP